jgi:mono/diheme cytochrome c family protein
MDGVLALVFLAALGLWCYYRPAPLEDQADPSKAYEARPEWYFMFLFQMLRYFHGPYEIVGTFVLPLLFFLVLFFWPFLDRGPHRDPRRRPVAIGLLVAGTVGLVGLTIYANATDVRMQEPELAKAKQEKPPAAGLLQQTEVAKLYGTHCATCHGVDGTGNQVRAGLRPTIPNFTQWAWQASHHELEIMDRIQGGSGPLMPAYRDLLSEPQMLALAVYVREFSATPVGPGVAKPAPPPESISHAMPVEEVYRSYCLGCHDTNGSGKIGRTIYRQVRDFPNFTDPKWQRSRQDKELRHSILEGKGQFMLPMKDKLSPADADRMVGLIRKFPDGQKVLVKLPEPPVPPSSTRPKVVRAPETPDRKPPSTAESEDRRARGRAATAIYRQYCFLCHGVDGRGTEMRSAMPKIPDFTSRSWQEDKSNPQLAVSILDGKELMPSFRGRVDDDVAQDLVAHIRAFGPARATAKEVPPDDFEKRYRKLEQEWDELQKQLDEVSPKRRKL